MEVTEEGKEQKTLQRTEILDASSESFSLITPSMSGGERPTSKSGMFNDFNKFLNTSAYKKAEQSS